MAETIQTDKQMLRQDKLRIRRGLSEEFHCQADAAISKQLGQLPEYQKASVIAAYAGDGTEPDLIPLLRHAREEGKTICFPRCLNEDSKYEMAEPDEKFTLVEGKWKMPEPSAECPSVHQSVLEHALWLVPGVAFDEQCGRLGRGKGIYDRFLAEIKGLAVGIFYECQKTAALPMEPHDRPLDAIVTEKQIYRRKKNKSEKE